MVLIIPFSSAISGPASPCPTWTGKQYAVMCAAVRKIAEEKLPANAKSEAGGREAALLNASVHPRLGRL